MSKKIYLVFLRKNESIKVNETFLLRPCSIFRFVDRVPRKTLVGHKFERLRREKMHSQCAQSWQGHSFMAQPFRQVKMRNALSDPLLLPSFFAKKLLRALHFSSTNFRAHRITLIYNFCPKLLISRGRNPWLSPAYAANGDRDILKLFRNTRLVKVFVPMKIVDRCWANRQINFPIRGTLRGKILRQIGRPAFRERFELQIQSSLGRWVNYQITIGSNTFSKLEVKKSTFRAWFHLSPRPRLRRQNN